MERHRDAPDEYARHIAAEITKRARNAAEARWNALPSDDPARGEAGRKAWRTRRKKASEAKRKARAKIISPA